MSTYDDASLIMFPSGYKEDKIYSLKPTDGSGDLTFTRASTATRVNSDGLIETSPYNLIEQSNSFNTGWSTTSGTSVTSGQSGYDGTNDAWLLTDSGSSPAYALYRGYSNTGIQSASIYAKQGSTSQLEFDFLGGSAGYLRVDLTDGSLHSTSNTLSWNTENVGNGWWRVSFSTNHTSAPVLFRIGCNGAGSIYIQDVQIDSGSTAKPYFPTTDRLNVPRIDYTGGGCGKLLLEPQRTNLLTYSEQIDNAAWTKANATITANSTTSPDGTTNADTINLSAGTTQKYIAQSYSQNGSYTQSVYFKKGTHSFVQLLTGGDVTKFATFDLINGTSSVTGGTATIQAAANGFYRCTFSYTTSTGNNITIIAVDSLAAARAASTSSTGNFYIYGAQLEAGSYVSSYVPTLASSVTRLADASFKTGISSLIGASEGSAYFNGNISDQGVGSAVFFEIVNGTSTTNTIVLYIDTANGRVALYLGTVALTPYLSATSKQGQNVKIAFRWKANDYSFYLDGTQVYTNTSAAAPSGMNTLRVGSNRDGTDIGKNLVNQVVLFPTALTNDQLADLTGGNITTFNALAEFYGYTIL